MRRPSCFGARYKHSFTAGRRLRWIHDSLHFAPIHTKRTFPNCSLHTPFIRIPSSTLTRHSTTNRQQTGSETVNLEHDRNRDSNARSNTFDRIDLYALAQSPRFNCLLCSWKVGKLQQRTNRDTLAMDTNGHYFILYYIDSFRTNNSQT